MAYLIQYKGLDKPGRESIHSGQFMVSQFEAEEQDDEDNVAVPIPEVIDNKAIVPVKPYIQGPLDCITAKKNPQQVAIDTSLSKLFQCMSLAYRQKLTSPKWNRFRGIRLRWKDKIRLNNVIWRCWHLQFIKKENTLICQFASPLDVDTHNKPEAIVLEGKYWKRKLAAVTAEYKKWRMFYRNNILGHTPKESMDMLNDVDALLFDSNSTDNMNMMVDEDYMGLMSDTLFSTITNQPFVFPDTREIARAGLADFIQPSLGPLQPNLDDYMDTFDPLQEFINNKLPTVPEEHSHWDYPETITTAELTVQVSHTPDSSAVQQYQPQIQDLNQQLNMQKSDILIQQDSQHNLMSSASFSDLIAQTREVYLQQQNFSSVISKTSAKSNQRAKLSHSHSIPPVSYNKPIESTQVHQGYSTQGSRTEHVIINDRIQVPLSKNCTPVQQHSQDLQQQHQHEQFRQPQQPSNQGYKFATPVRPTLKFTSQSVPQVQTQTHLMQQPSMHPPQPSPYHPSFSPVDDKMESRRRSTPRGRGRSRSNTREPIKRPPLISAVSDPALLTPQTNVLLTQLLTNSSPLSDAVYSQNQSLSTSQELSQHIRIKEETSPVPILPQPPPTTIISLPAQITVTPVSMSSSDPLLLSTYSNSSSPIMDSPQNLHSPTSSQGSIGSPGRDNNRDRRAGHIHAEQKRRCNIKNGFDMLHSLIPHLNQNPNAKLSKAAMLQKGAEYIRQLKSERNQIREEMDLLRQQIETLNTSISNCQSLLPATGAPVSRRRDNKMQEMFDDYVSNRTMDNWKFWIFSLICRPLLNSFNTFVSTSSVDDLYSSTMLWVEQHCTLGDLRPVVLNSLRYLCTKTEILTEPEKLPEEAKQIVLRRDK
ncbi:carbohydrate-responsive element-binding protein isoform X2 [Sitophilus oryzae]|uniref:Carbohydrate-responsive element-binding protein isoform X2 n=1 Tax=Sitophilus oryzae TaxID=7048 RepID=A0A6J2XUK6_SITOR|nr:carbohydrate-responsive element-binding protein isoform X2 [Sitophilus oryzae]